MLIHHAVFLRRVWSSLGSTNLVWGTRPYFVFASSINITSKWRKNPLKCPTWAVGWCEDGCRRSQFTGLRPPPQLTYYCIIVCIKNLCFLIFGVVTLLLIFVIHFVIVFSIICFQFLLDFQISILLLFFMLLKKFVTVLHVIILCYYFFLKLRYHFCYHIWWHFLCFFSVCFHFLVSFPSFFPKTWHTLKRGKILFYTRQRVICRKTTNNRSLEIHKPCILKPAYLYSGWGLYNKKQKNKCWN